MQRVQGKQKVEGKQGSIGKIVMKYRVSNTDSDIDTILRTWTLNLDDHSNCELHSLLNHSSSTIANACPRYGRT